MESSESWERKGRKKAQLRAALGVSCAGGPVSSQLGSKLQEAGLSEKKCS